MYMLTFDTKCSYADTKLFISTFQLTVDSTHPRNKILDNMCLLMYGDECKKNYSKLSALCPLNLFLSHQSKFKYQAYVHEQGIMLLGIKLLSRLKLEF